MKTTELTGAALDWAVAKAQGTHVEVTGIYRYLGRVNQELVGFRCYAGERDEFGAVDFTPSTDWSQGGPIIEREKINLKFYDEEWIADPHDIDSICQRKHGPTPLIAAMRCYVASKLGDEVEIPNELNGTLSPL